jgi:branched-chain amino acid transport system permease protein
MPRRRGGQRVVTLEIGAMKPRKLPLWAWALVFAIAAVLLFVPPFLKNYGIYLFSYWLVFVIATMGLNLTVGYAGQKSLGHAAFFGIGAYTVAILLKHGVSFWFGLPLAMVGCFVVGLVLGFPALRVQTIYLAFATLGFNTALWLVMRNEEWLTGGTFGINNITRPAIFGIDLSKNLAYYYFVLAVALIMGWLLWRLLASPWGKAFTALRDNPIRAESLGIHIQRYTLLSFAIGAVYAGVAGALFAPLVEYIEPAPFAVGASIMMYLMVVVGGAGTFFGPLLGSAVGVLLPEWLRFAQGWYLFVFGSAVILLMLWLPDGLLSIPERLRRRRLAREAAAQRSAAARDVAARDASAHDTAAAAAGSSTGGQP